MRINKISITNIASLQGTHLINLNDICSTSSLFAITGKTGSGKSTILNCISLALYGSTYKTSITSIDYITLGTEQGEIEVYYSIGSESYKANWRLRVRKKNGEALKKPLLNRANYQISSDGIETAIESQPEELIGLSFKQFCKTSILNQGQFAEFLMSKFSERKEILEKLYDGENLEKLNTKLKENLKSIKEEEDKLSHQVKGLSDALETNILSTKELEELSRDIQNNLELNESFFEVKKLAKDILNLTDTITNNKTRLEITGKQYKQEKENFIHASKTRDQINDEKEKLQAILLERKPFLIKAIEKNQELSNLKKQKQRVDLALNKNKQKLNDNKTRQNEYEKEIENLEQRIQKAYKLYPFFKDLDNNLFSKSFEDFLEIKTILPKLENESISKLSSIEELQQRLQKLNTTNEEIQDQIEKLSTEVIQFDKKEKTETLFSLKKNSEFLSNILLSQTKNIEQKSHLITLIDTNTKNYENAKTKYELETLKLSNIEKDIQLNNALASIDLLIEKSKQNGYCILCETKHPPSFHYPERNIDQNLFKERDIIQNQVQNLETQVKKFLEMKNKDELKLENINTLLIKENEEKEILEKKILSTIGKPFSKKSINSFTKELENQIELNENKNEKLLILKNQFTNNLNSEEEIKKEIQKKKTEYKETNDQIETKNQDLETLKSRFIVFSQTIEEVKRVNIHKEQLQKILNELNFLKQNTTIIRKTIQDILNEIEGSNQENITITDNITRLELYISENKIPENPSSELEKLENQISDITLNLTNANNDLKIIEIKLAELRSKVDNYKDQIKQTELFLKTTFVDLRESANQVSNRKHPSEILKIKEINLKFSHFQPEDLHKEVFAETLKELEKQIDLFKEFNQMKRDHYVREENKTKIHSTNQKKIKKLSLEINKLQSKLEKLNNLNILIGKDEFRNYVLSIIENNLLEQTNAELNLLCQGRYILGQTNKTNKMASEFIVIDNFRDGMSRKVATLSGGETFLVSLAMAMALAELTRGKTQVDSLFIDEGFGTLDSDSINEVYELLQNIQNSGKQIGIISHVSDLTNRIPVNVYLKKNQQGISDISILLN